jgi:methyl-accepting chemotaxis protein
VTSRLVTLGLASLALALGAAACGGDEEDPAREWAGGVCTSIGDWQAEVEGNVQELTEDPGSLSAESIRTAAEDSLAATDALRDELRALGTPETESGEQAREEVDQLSESLEQRADRVREALDSAEGAAGLLSAVGAVTTEVQGAAADTRQTLDELRQLEPGGELQQAFEDEDSCSELQE